MLAIVLCLWAVTLGVALWKIGIITSERDQARIEVWNLRREVERLQREVDESGAVIRQFQESRSKTNGHKVVDMWGNN